MFILLLIPIFNSIFLALISLLLQLSISSFSINFSKYFKFLLVQFLFSKSFWLIFFICLVFVFEKFLGLKVFDLFEVLFVVFKWNNYMIKIFIKIGIIIFLLIMISYISIFGHFLFFWNYISIICGFTGVSLGVGLFNWLMSIIVIIISSLVLITSIDYLDILYTIYFLCLLSYFQLFMLGFIFTDSLIIMYVNWDWLGIISYLLINLYFNSQKNGLKAIIFNKLGDIVFLILIAYFIYYFLPLINFFPLLSINLLFNIFLLFFSSALVATRTSSLTRTDPDVSSASVSRATAACLPGGCVSSSSATSKWGGTTNVELAGAQLAVSCGLLVVFFTKSAQLPFSSWLINAMAAPTPVSSLLHSSTMVIIGIFLCLLLSPTLYVLMNLFNYMNIYFINFCAFTMLWSLFKAFSSLNMKSVIAYSTVNQLSYMFLSFKICSLIVLLHIIVHAVFKCMLFLIAGSLIHTSLNFQNIFKITFFSSNSRKIVLNFNVFNFIKLFKFLFWLIFWILLILFSVGVQPLQGGCLSKSLLKNYKQLKENYYSFWKFVSCATAAAAVQLADLELGLVSNVKILYISFLIGSFMLIFALSKELIIIGLMNIISSSFLFYLVLIGAIGTIIYSFILIYFIFFSSNFYIVDFGAATGFIFLFCTKSTLINVLLPVATWHILFMIVWKLWMIYNIFYLLKAFGCNRCCVESQGGRSSACHIKKNNCFEWNNILKLFVKLFLKIFFISKCFDFDMFNEIEIDESKANAVTAKSTIEINAKLDAMIFNGHSSLTLDIGTGSSKEVITRTIKILALSKGCDAALTFKEVGGQLQVNINLIVRQDFGLLQQVYLKMYTSFWSWFPSSSELPVAATPSAAEAAPHAAPAAPEVVSRATAGGGVSSAAPAPAGVVDRIDLTEDASDATAAVGGGVSSDRAASSRSSLEQLASAAEMAPRAAPAAPEVNKQVSSFLPLFSSNK